MLQAFIAREGISPFLSQHSRPTASTSTNFKNTMVANVKTSVLDITTIQNNKHWISHSLNRGRLQLRAIRVYPEVGDAITWLQILIPRFLQESIYQRKQYICGKRCIPRSAQNTNTPFFHELKSKFPPPFPPNITIPCNTSSFFFLEKR